MISPGALDALEGNLRKRLNDRRAREGDEGVRTRLQPLVASVLELRSLVCWPVGGKDLDVIDSVGVNPEGSPIATAARSSLSIAALGVILDAALELRASLCPSYWLNAEAPVRLDLFRLALIAKEFAPGSRASSCRCSTCPMISSKFAPTVVTGGSKYRCVVRERPFQSATGRGRRGRGGADRLTTRTSRAGRLVTQKQARRAMGKP